MSLEVTTLSKEHEKEFQSYSQLLLQWNQKINLTAITDPNKVRELHFLDSLSVVSEIVSRGTIVPRETISILDIGTGAGLPGLVIKIVRPEIQVTLVDAVKKKTDFLKTVIRELGLKGVTVLHQFLKKEDKIGSFDVIVSRAAFKMPELISLAVPNLKPSGRIIAMKGPHVSQETKGCDDLLSQCQLRPFEEVHYYLPDSKQERRLLITSF